MLRYQNIHNGDYYTTKLSTSSVMNPGEFTSTTAHISAAHAGSI